MHDDRFFDPDPAVRRLARSLYDETRSLPLICPQGHVDSRMLSENAAFPEPSALLITPDHYIFRMLYSRGVPMEDLGIPTRDGGTPTADPRRVWQLFAAHYYLFRGTPTGVWLDYELHELFGVRVKLGPDTAQRVYDEIQEKLCSPEFKPRALFERFNIEVLATTDAATDSLEHHQAIRNSGWPGRVIPTVRPALRLTNHPVQTTLRDSALKARGLKLGLAIAARGVQDGDASMGCMARLLCCDGIGRVFVACAWQSTPSPSSRSRNSTPIGR